MNFHLYSAAVLAFATSAAYGQSQAVQWRVEDGGNGHWYEVTASITWNWQQAQDSAVARGGHLATLTSPAENAWVKELLGIEAPGQEQAFIGGFQDRSASDYSEPAGGWRWVTGEVMSWTAWTDGNPSNAMFGPCGCEDFMTMVNISISPISWNDVSDDFGTPSLYGSAPAIVEWSADCNNDGIVDYGQILSGQLMDANSNGIPDSCDPIPCLADVNNSGAVNGVDLAAVLGAWGTDGQAEGDADITNDGIVDGEDLAYVLSGWGPCSTVPAWAMLIEFLPNPAVVFDPTLRAAITATGLPWRVRDTVTQIELVLIPPGTFMMGCSESAISSCREDESPVRTVSISQPFYMGRYEVTQAQWTTRMGSNPSWFQTATAAVPASQVPERPVERVSWFAAQDFLSSTSMRLPTEAEWEYAYRAGTTTAFHSMPGYPHGTNDGSLLGNIAWFDGNSDGQTRPVGVKAGNGFGLHDMAGNAREWCNDWYGATYYASADVVDPVGPSEGVARVARGGSFYWQTIHCRASDRAIVFPENAFNYYGFRVVRNP